MEVKEQMGPRGANSRQDTVQMINFQVGNDEYAVNIQTVREVINLHEITPLPKASSFVKGIINLRGEVIPIIDLREKFGLTHAEYDEFTNIIIVEIEDKIIGVVVDRVSHVIRLSGDALSPAPPLIGGLSSRYVSGVARLEHRLIVVLNMSKVLTAEEMIELKTLEASGQGSAASSKEVQDDAG